MTQSFLDKPQGSCLVSVVVPVFNTPERLIQRAVDSVMGQTYPYFELLIVDDGSEAATAAFLDLLGKKDHRIRILHKENGGVSTARNTGIRDALGNYIAFLDADDYIEPVFLSDALRVAQSTDADLVFGAIQVLHGKGSTGWRLGAPPSSQPFIGTAETIVCACVKALADSPVSDMETSYLSVTNVVSCLYKTDAARQHEFPEGVSHAEDRLYNLKVLLDARSVAFCSDSWYVYDATHEQGVTRRLTQKTVSALSRTVQEFAHIRTVLAGNASLSDNARFLIEQAAANGALNYLKLLAGVVTVAGRNSSGRAQLRDLLKDPAVAACTALAKQPGLQTRLFTAAARLGQSDLLLLLGWFWVRRGGLQMKVRRPSRPQREG